MTRPSDAISPTAHYTGYTWYRNGLSHPALATATGRRFHRAMRPFNALGEALGLPTLDAVLLARHRLIDQRLEQAITEGRIGQVIEIAAGLSPRGWDFKRRHGDRLRYIEADLPAMAARKRALLQDAGLAVPGHEVVEIDALADDGPLSLARLAADLDTGQGLAIVTEGLLNYFDREAVLGMWRRFAAVLARFPHGLYWSDLHLSAHNRDPATAAFGAVLSMFVRGRVHFHFRDEAQAHAALLQAGFGSAELLDPRVALPAYGLPVGAGAGRVRVIQAAARAT